MRLRSPGSAEVPWTVAALCLLLLHPWALDASALSPHDTVTLAVTGDAAASFDLPSGFRAQESGTAFAEYRHWFDGRYDAVASARFNRTSQTPLLEQALLGVHGNVVTAEAGFAAERLGLTILYKPNTARNPFYDRPLLWEAYGLGARMRVRAGPADAGAGIMLNYRESGSAFLSGGMHGSHVVGLLMAGFQTYSPWDQDNDLTVGGEVTGRWAKVAAHALAGYLHGYGYGNSSMRVGDDVRLLGELSANPLRIVTVDAVAFWESYRKAYSHESLTLGIDAQVAPTPWIGCGGGAELTRDNAATTTTPEAYLIIGPGLRYGHVDAGWRCAITGNASLVNSIFGNVWFAF